MTTIGIMFTELLSFDHGVNYAIAPLIVPIALSLLGIGIGCLVHSKTKKTNGVSLGVIGMTASGKSTFLSKLGLVEYTEATAVDDYPSKTIAVGGRKITINAGQDIGGGEVWIKNYYADWMLFKDIIVFVFDGNEYLTDANYRRQTNSRLHHIYTNYKKRPGAGEFENVVLIASHSDLYKDGNKKMYNKILESVQGKKYSKLFNINFFAANLTNDKEIDEIKKKIF